MKLEKWMKANRWTMPKLAEKLGIGTSTIHRFIHGTNLPNQEIMHKIFKLSNGKVRPSDFYSFGGK